MKSDVPELRYLVTTHAHLPGVRLSKPGYWGNIPYPDIEAARIAAETDARGQRFRLEQRAFPALPNTVAPEFLTR